LPQLCVSAVVSTQRFEQTAFEPTHVHWPPMHPIVEGHTVLQFPHVFGLVCVFTQLPLHAVSPLGQAHPPLMQLAPVGHWRPQTLQFFVSLEVSTQAPPQIFSVA
jgi:hypothetical protein